MVRGLAQGRPSLEHSFPCLSSQALTPKVGPQDGEPDSPWEFTSLVQSRAQLF